MCADVRYIARKKRIFIAERDKQRKQQHKQSIVYRRRRHRAEHKFQNKRIYAKRVDKRIKVRLGIVVDIHRLYRYLLYGNAETLALEQHIGLVLVALSAQAAENLHIRTRNGAQSGLCVGHAQIEEKTEKKRRRTVTERTACGHIVT